MLDRIVLIIAMFACLAVPSVAQLDVNGPNAKQLIQGQVGHVVDPVDHDVEVPLPGTFTLSIESGVNSFAPITTIMSSTAPTAGVVPTPWGGSIDLGIWDPVTVLTQVTIIGDGITFQGSNAFLDSFWLTDGGNIANGITPRFDFSLSLTPAVFQPNQTLITRTFQSIVFDPTNAPFNLDNTEVTQANFRFGQESVLKTGEDGSVTVDFLPGSTFKFHGQSYTQVHVHANGFVTFGGTTTMAMGGATNDHVTWVADQPSIAAVIADWSPDANSVDDGIYFEERGSLVRIAWGDPRAQTTGGMSHRFDTDQNRFEIILELDNGNNPNEGAFAVSMTSLDPGAMVGLGRGLVGHTPGGAALLDGAFDVNLRSEAQSAGPGVAQLEEHDLDLANASNVGYDGAGARRGYNQITKSWDASVLIFVPKTGTGVTGANGYDSVPPAQLPDDDIQRLDLSTLKNEGNEILVISGSFFGFDPTGTGAGTAVFDPQGLKGGPYPAIILAIGDETGQSGPLSTTNTQPSEARDGQALAILTPDFLGAAAGPMDLELTFASGFVGTVSANIGAQTQFGAVYLQNDDDFVSHPLSVPITFYGQTYNTMYIGSNGYVTFGAGSNVNSGGQFSMNTGYGFANNPGVAALFTDLNPIGMLSGSVYEVLEDATLGTVTVTFKFMAYWTTNEPAGTASITFGDNGPNSFSLDLSGVIPTIAGVGPVSFGVSNGDFASPMTDLTNGSGTGLFSLLPAAGGAGYTSAAPGDSIAEDFPRNIALPFTGPIQFIDMATSAPYGLWFVQ